MYTISRSIFAILNIQFICKSRHYVHITYSISAKISLVRDIQFFCKSRNSVHIYFKQFPVEFSQFWRFNFSKNPDIPQIYNVYNFPLNFWSSGYSYFLQIQTFYAYILYIISLLIYVILDIQFLWKSKHSVNLLNRISSSIFATLNIQFIYKSIHYVHITYTISH